MSVIAFSGLLGGLVIVLVGIGFLLRRVGNRGYEYDEDDDDFMDDDEDSFSTRNQTRSVPLSTSPSRGSPQSRSPPSSPGPSRGPPGGKTGPSRGPPGAKTGPSRGPPGSSSGPSRGPPGSKTGPSRGPPGGAPSGPKRTPQPVSVGKKPIESTQVNEDKPQKKVRKARIEVDMTLFEDWQTDDREAAVDWVVDGLADEEQERSILMQLQETGWTAQQSRAIFDLARNR